LVGVVTRAVAVTACLAAIALPFGVHTLPAGARSPGAGNHAARSAGCHTHEQVTTGVSTHALVSGGRERVFQLDVPADYTGTMPFGLVLALHPLSVVYTYMPSVVRFSTNAASYRFIGVAPSGLVSDGTPYWDAAPTSHNYDVDFLSSLVRHLESTLCIDTSEVFSTGLSNGAQMSSLLGCRLSGLVSAIAPVEGEEYLTPCPGKPEPILAFHGTADPVLPYSGGGLNATRIADIYYFHGHEPAGLPAPMGIDDSMRDWARHNGCTSKARTVRIAPDVQKRTWSGCKAATVLYIVDGGGHGWPGQPVAATEKVFGPETTQIDATNLMMRFFFDHQRGTDDARAPA
jgi:polyhydroxybutyrate depolymerase